MTYFVLASLLENMKLVFSSTFVINGTYSKIFFRHLFKETCKASVVLYIRAAMILMEGSLIPRNKVL